MTNALFELLGSTILKEEYEKLLKSGTTFDDYQVNEVIKRGRAKVELLPDFKTTPVKEWFSRVKFARVVCCNEYCEGEICATLKSKRDLEDEQEFYNTLNSMIYDAGYGSQQLFGVIVFNDGTWLERREYDGSEWWTKNTIPQEEDYVI